jgi:hypothetical protein
VLPTGSSSRAERQAYIAAAVSIVLMAGAIASDFVVGSFWARHAMLTSVVANLLVVVLSVVVINEMIERRSRRRWNLLAQSVLFELLQGARLTWTSMVEMLGLASVRSGSVQSLLDGAQAALERSRVSDATTALLGDPERRERLQRVVQRLSDHTSGVIATWAGVMVGAAPYAHLLDRHVELSGRLQWLSAVLAHNEPAPDQDFRRARLTLSSVATEHADEFDDNWIHDMIVAITVQATQLDYDSRTLAFSLAPGDWWFARTRDLAGT